MRAVLELAGIHDILSKSLGSQNPINLVKATVQGLEALRTPREVAAIRGLSINEVLGLAAHRENGEHIAAADADAPAEVADAGDAASAGGDRVMALKVTQVKSRNGSKQNQLDTLRSLGLRRIGHTVEVSDTPQSRGMIYTVRHLVVVEEDQS